MESFDFSEERLMTLVDDASDYFGNRLKLGDPIYRGEFYEAGRVRNMIFSCLLDDQPCVLKVVNDPRTSASLEGLIMNNFANFESSDASGLNLSVPKVHAFNRVDENRGWLVMERLPEGVRNIANELSVKKKIETYVGLYQMYRNSFPTAVPAELSKYFVEVDNATFVQTRFRKWRKLMQIRADKVGGEYADYAKEVIDLFAGEIFGATVLSEINDIESVFCHGHFKPAELLTNNKQDWWLIDFAHCKTYYSTYEPAFFIWSEVMMQGDYSKPYDEWRADMKSWASAFTSASEIPNAKRKLEVGLLERIVGTLYADIWGSDQGDFEEKKLRSDYLINFGKEIVVNKECNVDIFL